MKIRTITLGVPKLPTINQLEDIGDLLSKISGRFESHGYSVQTLRVVLPDWDTKGMGSLPESEIIVRAAELALGFSENGIDYVAVGGCKRARSIRILRDVLGECSTFYGVSNSLNVANDELICETISTILSLSKVRSGLANFQFAAGFQLRQTPFFPAASMNSDSLAFSVGCENTDSIIESLKMFPPDGRNILGEKWQVHVAKKFEMVEQVAMTAARELGVEYAGIDTSIAPSIDPQHSIVKLFELLGTQFGSMGSLAVASRLTQVIRSSHVKQIGFCGLMLPVLEDAGLASLAKRNAIDIQQLLLLSAVCGVGVDMVPIRGDVDFSELKKLIVDVGTLSVRLSKPLQVRVLPMIGKNDGDAVEFRERFLCSSAVVPL